MDAEYNHTFLSKHDLEKKISRLLNLDNYNKVLSAYEIAEDVHWFQKKRDGSSLFFHVTRTAKIIIDELLIVNSDLLCIALLHDTLENSETLTSETLRYNFGDKVLSIVELLTIKSKEDFRANPQNIDRYVEQLSKAPIEAIIVKLVDRLDNFRCLKYGAKLNPISFIEETCQKFIPLVDLHKHFALVKLKELIYFERTKFFN
jgi:(p)ppGpp synthase/HD superfamily hydrolase